jgi:hypothetical protein
MNEIPEEFSRSSWKKFIAQGRYMYMGSTTDYSMKGVLKNLKKHEADKGPYVEDRVFRCGVSALQFTLPDQSVSYLDRRGKVYRYGDYFIIHDDPTVIVYRMEGDKLTE